MWTSHLQTLIYWYVIYWGMIWYGIIQNAQHWGANNTTSLIAIFVLTSSNTTHSEHIKYIDEITIPYQPWYQEIWLRTAICIFTTYQKVNEMFVCCNNISKGQMIALCFPQFHSTLYIPPISSFFSLVPHHTQSEWNKIVFYKSCSVKKCLSIRGVSLILPKSSFELVRPFQRAGETLHSFPRSKSNS